MARCIALLLVGVFAVGQSKGDDSIQSQALGKWHRKAPDGIHHLVKDVQENRETLSVYDAKGELTYQHAVLYEIKSMHDLSVFEYWNLEVLVNTQAEEAAAEGESSENVESEPTPERRRYLFKIQDNRWFEVPNLWAAAEPAPRLVIYERAGDDFQVTGQKSEESAYHGVNPKAAMNYFAGQWHSTGEVGDSKYTGRVNAEWDLHHNALVSRFEFFGGSDGASLLTVNKWDDFSKTLIDKHFSSWGIHRDASYKIEPHGKFFKLVGTSVQTSANEKTVADVVITVEDQNHYTWQVTPREEGKPGMIEKCTRVTGAAN